jgi:carbamoyltransferase
MLILGISCYYHNSAAALIHDGDLIAAVEEERFSRIKQDSAFPENSIQFCLQQAGISANDLDHVVFYETPNLKFERILGSALGTFPKSWKSFSEAMISWFDQKLWIKQRIQEELNIDGEKIHFTEHHQSHAASTFLTSPFDEATVITIDGVGEWATTTVGVGRTNLETKQSSLVIQKEQEFPHSIGLLYSAFTAFLGFRVNGGEYKVMGMSPYGEPNHIDKIEKIFKVADDGSFWMDSDYFSYTYSTEKTFNKKFEALFGQPRVHETDFFTKKTHPNMQLDASKAKDNQYYADIAASIQRATELAILKMISASYEGIPNLCMAGGVALNSKANGRILKDTPFEHLHIQPAAGDAGGALGAALYHYHIELGHPRKFVQEHCYWGPEYSNAEIVSAVKEKGYSYSEISNQKKLSSLIVEKISSGKVVSLFQGRAEWGPRALGNRSIIADPRRDDMKEIVNSMIKFREPFRPFAPVVLEKDAGTLFPDLANQAGATPPRFMLVVHPWESKFGEKVPAVNHLGTGRMQTIKREWNPLYHDLVSDFGESTGIPVLMNTSFNLRGEPIVNTPANALNTFTKSNLDLLVMENIVVEKKNNS